MSEGRPLRVLLVVPPLGGLDRPGLGIHLLQALGRRAGHEVRVLYANLLYAAAIGERQYANFGHFPGSWLLGERVFARAAYGVPPLGRDRGGSILEEVAAYLRARGNPAATAASMREVLLDLEAAAHAWVDVALARVLEAEPDVVGCGSTFEQTAASVALLAAVKAARPAVTTIMGGANCEAEMATGIAAVAPGVDHVFSGESEASFLEFLARRARGEPSPRVIAGTPCRDLDALPTPDFGEYYAQLGELLPGSETLARGPLYLPYETSRGCWWGATRHCTFCGLNGEGMGFRKKSPARVLDDLEVLMARHPTNQVAVTDNIMPHEFFDDLLPALAARLPGLEIGFEQKSNLSLEKVRRLAAAGVTEVQPGIEALSTGLLRLMRKGVTGSQNLAALRYARALGVNMHWNLLVAFPRDELAFYTETLALLPHLRHLRPPSVVPVVISRFSPYFDDPGAHGVSDLRPMPAYADVLPEGAPAAAVAYHFTATYPSESLDPANRPVMEALAAEVMAWKRAWAASPGAPPVLHVAGAPGDEAFELVDTRAGGEVRRPLDRDQARTLLVRRPTRRVPREDMAWALAPGWVVELDASWVPLATASPHLLAAFESEEEATWRARRRARAADRRDAVAV